jgi:hypothetical protein
MNVGIIGYRCILDRRPHRRRRQLQLRHAADLLGE